MFNYFCRQALSYRLRTLSSTQLQKFESINQQPLLIDPSDPTNHITYRINNYLASSYGHYSLKPTNFYELYNIHNFTNCALTSNACVNYLCSFGAQPRCVSNLINAQRLIKIINLNQKLIIKIEFGMGRNYHSLCLIGLGNNYLVLQSFEDKCNLFQSSYQTIAKTDLTNLLRQIHLNTFDSKGIQIFNQLMKTQLHKLNQIQLIARIYTFNFQTLYKALI